LKEAIAVLKVECVAMTDVYTRRHDEVRAKLVPKVEAYTDYHKLLDRFRLHGPALWFKH
jgi:hypothetical protein